MAIIEDRFLLTDMLIDVRKNSSISSYHFFPPKIVLPKASVVLGKIFFFELTRKSWIFHSSHANFMLSNNWNDILQCIPIFMQYFCEIELLLGFHNFYVKEFQNFVKIWYLGKDATYNCEIPEIFLLKFLYEN